MKLFGSPLLSLITGVCTLIDWSHALAIDSQLSGPNHTLLPRASPPPRRVTVVSDYLIDESIALSSATGERVYPSHTWVLIEETDDEIAVVVELVQPALYGGRAIAVTFGSVSWDEHKTPPNVQRRSYTYEPGTSLSNVEIFDGRLGSALAVPQRSKIEQLWIDNARGLLPKKLWPSGHITNSHNFAFSVLLNLRLNVDAETLLQHFWPVVQVGADWMATRRAKDGQATISVPNVGYIFYKNVPNTRASSSSYTFGLNKDYSPRRIDDGGVYFTRDARE